jgi:hypothetical protein
MRYHIPRILAAGLALGLPAMTATAKSVDKKTAWGAATAASALGAVLQAKDHPTTAAVLAAGAVYSYTQYDKARKDDGNDRYRDRRYDENDPYGYGSASGRRPVPGDSTRYNNRTRDVSGIVTKDTGAFDRRIRVRLDNGRERTVDVPKDVAIRRDGRTISVHDIKKDDQVRIRLDRFSDDGNLEARRLDVVGRVQDRWNDDRDGGRDAYRETRGTVSSIDSRNGILRIRVDGRTVNVDVRRADIRDNRGALPLRDLQYGDRVTVYGTRDRDDIQATRVTVGY